MLFTTLLAFLLVPLVIAKDRCETVYGEGWTQLDPASDSCYFFGGKGITFRKAQKNCGKKLARLVQIETPEENRLIFEKIKRSSENRWIGMNVDHSSGIESWIYSSGVQADYTNWGEQQPDNHTGREKCVVMLKSDGSWNDVNCDKTVKTICEKSLPLLPSCSKYGENWKHLDLSISTSCYFFCKKDSTFRKAKNKCKRLKGRMVTIESAEENKMLWDAIKRSGHHWIGMKVDHTGPAPTYWWNYNKSAPVTYTNWSPNEPNNHSGNGENCVNISKKHGKWNDIPCNKPMRCLCEI